MVLPYPRPIVVVMCLSRMVTYLKNVQIVLHILTVLTSVNRCTYLVLKAWMGIDMVQY